ncbi:MAG TPA: MoxR family ATPase [Streptosporangiaceae bacterium]|nr:MoxR family ATPase [Streptosporangiaceae bacterium]
MTAQMRAAVPGAPARWFSSAEQIAGLLRSVDYLANEHTCNVLRLADQLGKPILVEGPAGTGKTELAKSTAAMTGARLIRLQCYEGLDEGKALYEWNYQKQLLRIQADNAGTVRRAGDWANLESGIFTRDFLLPRPLLEAIQAADPVVLLIDEVDRMDIEAEALLLEILSDYQVSIPELGTVSGSQVPMVFLTSNSSRDLSEALRRRCLYLHIDYPPAEREREIVRTRVPGISAHLAEQIAAIVGSLRQLDIRQRPSVSQTLEWARTLLTLGAENLDAGLVADSLRMLLSYQSDIELAASRLACGQLP